MITLTLHPQHLAIIGAALKKLPWELADPVLVEIDRQIKEAKHPQPEQAGSEYEAISSDAMDRGLDVFRQMTAASDEPDQVRSAFEEGVREVFRG